MTNFDEYRVDRTLYRFAAIVGKLLGKWTDERNIGSRERNTLEVFLAEAKEQLQLPDSVIEALRRQILTFEACFDDYKAVWDEAERRKQSPPER